MKNGASGNGNGSHDFPELASSFQPARLWVSRRNRFLIKTLPYWRDVLRSGAGMLLAMLMLTAIPAYSWALDRLPPDFPFLWVAVPLLTLALAYSPIRTYLVGADRIFLLPAEPLMAAYLRRAFRAAYVRQALITALTLVALWPLYLRIAGGEAMPIAWPLLLAAAAKICALAASAQEPRLLRRSVRALAICARWALMASVAYALWRYGAVAGAAMLVASALALYAVHALAAKQGFPWERLIAGELKQIARLYHFLSWFTDVPGLAGAVKKRTLLSALTRFYTFNPKTSLLYLYTKTFLRREPFAMVLRVTIVAGLMLILFRHPYVQAAIAILSLLMSGLQTASLGQYHRYTAWMYLYPLEKSAESSAIGRILTITLTFQSLVLSVCLILSGFTPILALAGFCGGAAYAAAYGLIVTRRKPHDEFYL